MTVFALLHGSGDGGWAWHLVQDALARRGYDAVAPDLPTDREDATWEDCVAAVAEAVGDAEAVVPVAHSAGGLVLPLVADRLGARLQVFVAGLVPRPGETANEWFGNVGWAQSVAVLAEQDGGLTGSEDPRVAFYHDVPDHLADEALARERPTSERLADSPWPLSTRPAIPAKYVVTARDRFLPASVQRRVADVRLGISDPDEVDTGHCAPLARPDELADLLAGYAVQLSHA